MFRYFFIPQLEDATCLSLAHTSINADCPSGKAPDKLVDRITKGSNPVYIRGYGRDAKNTELYINMYKELFPSAIVLKDGTNNAKPKSNLEKRLISKEMKTYLITRECVKSFL